MTTLIHRTGNLFDSDAPAIGHGVNAHGLMGAGIALAFRETYPDMFEAYAEHCRSTAVQGGDLFTWDTGERVVYNIFSQLEPGPNASYGFLALGVHRALQDARERGFDRIALPRIGSGIGGLEEGKVEDILHGLARGTGVSIELVTFA